MSKILNVSCDTQTVTFAWAETQHVYRLKDGMTAHHIRVAFANYINNHFHVGDLMSSGPVARSTGDAYEQGIEYGFKLAGHWVECDITVEWYPSKQSYVVFDGKEQLPGIFPTFKLARDAVDTHLRPKEGAGGLQYDPGLVTLLCERNLSLNHTKEYYVFTDKNGVAVSIDPSLGVAIHTALERTKT